ncbi:hypothetical protein DPMN_123181 [Dreissena polymorpha]|uniref:Uncharacterized protein n=1 Tax=Dreissena polymorpha TaxID=45954 RepID=A0A9D4GWX8_DREPO|nr:hypothetical protein DPMN_123181 [Dreissena polymorpha]
MCELIHEDKTKQPYTENIPTPGGHLSNVLTKFHKDWTIHVTSSVNKRHAFEPTGTIFELAQYIIGSCVLTKFYYNWTINPGSAVSARSSKFFNFQFQFQFFTLPDRLPELTPFSPPSCVLSVVTQNH